MIDSVAQVSFEQEYEAMEFIVKKLLEEYKKWVLKINVEKIIHVSWGAETKDLMVEDENDLFEDVVKIKKTDKKMISRTGLIKVEQ